jgi:hypothetical protein
MKNAKDTFYVTLRDRLATVNPERTFVLRGAVRPGIMVVENEMVSAELPADVFLLRWTDLQVDSLQAMPVATMRCEIQYFTDGKSDNAGMDRGRALTKMDTELLKMLTPQSAAKMNYRTTPPSALQSSIFWGDAVFESVAVNAERVERLARVDVTSYEEPGE